ncbi:hypothetical protein COB21_04795 [Candidatus Aerophobetes bacterium]|uniref:Uncharacterized protein n=1 Tax=Aerophobetes bacterium TaxID=2030807 RepID=A0A2A4X259_UNCAE|nr:MAG: hypothetical protein COB21_04795 [Candidatus Aerophobetes bacterium]
MAGVVHASLGTSLAPVKQGDAVKSAIYDVASQVLETASPDGANQSLKDRLNVPQANVISLGVQSIKHLLFGASKAAEVEQITRSDLIASLNGASDADNVALLIQAGYVLPTVSEDAPLEALKFQKVDTDQGRAARKILNSMGLNRSTLEKRVRTRLVSQDPKEIIRLVDARIEGPLGKADPVKYHYEYGTNGDPIFGFPELDALEDKFAKEDDVL